MKYWIILLLFFTGCATTPTANSFYVGQKVEVKNGSFEKCTGFIIAYSCFLESESYIKKYKLDLDLGCSKVPVWFYEEDLKRVK